MPLLAEVAKPEDESYFNSLYQVWELLGITDRVDMGNAYYRRGEDFYKRRDFEAACQDFDRAIGLGYVKAAARREIVVQVRETLKDEKVKLIREQAKEQAFQQQLLEEQKLTLAKQKQTEEQAKQKLLEEQKLALAKQKLLEEQQVFGDDEDDEKEWWEDFDYDNYDEDGKYDDYNELLRRFQDDEKEWWEDFDYDNYDEDGKYDDYNELLRRFQDGKLDGKLEQLLSAGKWREADKETTELMLKCANREKEGYLDARNCRNFPQEELRIIDQLWLKYSQNKFGFSVQKKIWLDNGGKLDGNYDWNTYCELGDRVGWRKAGDWLNYSGITFNINALPGHLPVVLREDGVGRGWGGRGGYSFLFSKL